MKCAVFFLVVHLLYCLATGLLLRAGLLRWGKGLFPLAAFVPLWGTLGALVVQHKSAAARPWSAAGSLYDTTETPSALSADLPCRAAELVPLEEALLLDPAEQRRRLMLLLLTDDPVRHYALLELARRNRDSEVAHYAAAAMALAGKRADQALEKRRQQYERAPREATARAAYRQQLQEILENKLVEGRAAVLLQQQLEALLRTEMQKAPCYDTGCQLAGVQLALGDFAAAGQTALMLTRQRPQCETAWLLRLRCAAAGRDGAALHAVLQEIREQNVWLSAAGRESLRFWQEDTQEEGLHETSG